jgi:hypothetical protein
MIKIDKNVPVYVEFEDRDKHMPIKITSKYPFKVTEPGDSFFVPKDRRSLGAIRSNPISSTPESAALRIAKSIDQSAPWGGQTEYDPHYAPDGCVAVPVAPSWGCDGCKYNDRYG